MNRTPVNKDYDVVVIGGGPAGSTMAVRLAQLGHKVCVLERQQFPRHHIGESLSPGIWTQLEMLGAIEAFTALPNYPCRQVSVRWPGQPQEDRQISGSPGVLVNRHQFDSMLLHFAIGHGVDCLLDSKVLNRVDSADGWQLTVAYDNQTLMLNSRFIVDASGRTGFLPGEKQQNGPRTFCLYGYWQAKNLPLIPVIEGTPSCWVWGMPLPDDTYNAMVFVDESALKAADSGRQLYHQQLLQSGLLNDLADKILVGKVMVADATAAMSLDPISKNAIKVGEAALALDPLSSSGVQKAIQTALSGAIAVHTLLKNPATGEAAISFYRQTIKASAEQHQQWAQEFYATGAEFYDTPFWQRRAHFAEIKKPQTAAYVAAPIDDSTPFHELQLELSAEIQWSDIPCITGEFIELHKGLTHPAFDEPVAFFSGHALAPLLQALPEQPLNPVDIASLWQPQLPFETALSLVGWLMGHGLLAAKSIA